MVAHECYNLPPRKFHTATLLHQANFIRGGMFSGNVVQDTESANSFRIAAASRPDTQLGRGLAHLKNYSHRELSYNNDMLNAFRGILSAHNLVTTFGLLLGTRFLNSQLSDSKFQPQVEKNALLAALVGWWHIKAPAERVAEFPSWTWAGWRGKLQTHRPTEYLRCNTDYNYYTPTLEVHYASRHARDVGYAGPTAWRCVPVGRPFPKGPELLFTNYHKLNLDAWKVAAKYPRRPAVTIEMVKMRHRTRMDMSRPAKDSALLGKQVDFLYIRTVADDLVFLVVRYLKGKAWEFEGGTLPRVCERIGVAHITPENYVDAIGGLTSVLSHRENRPFIVR